MYNLIITTYFTVMSYFYNTVVLNLRTGIPECFGFREVYLWNSAIINIKKNRFWWRTYMFDLGHKKLNFKNWQLRWFISVDIYNWIYKINKHIFIYEYWQNSLYFRYIHIVLIKKCIYFPNNLKQFSHYYWIKLKSILLKLHRIIVFINLVL